MSADNDEQVGEAASSADPEGEASQDESGEDAPSQPESQPASGEDAPSQPESQPASGKNAPSQPGDIEPAVRSRPITLPPEDIDLPPPNSVPRPQNLPAPVVRLAAEVTLVSPEQGPTIGGIKITIEGKHLYRESIVRVGGAISATIGAREPSMLSVEAPPRKTAGLVEISVQNPGAELVVLENAFRYVPLPPPKITSVAPNRAAVKGGTELTISGEGFIEDTVVTLDGAESKVLFIDSATLELITPAGEHGTMVDVVVSNPDGKEDRAPRAFMYDERY